VGEREGFFEEDKRICTAIIVNLLGDEHREEAHKGGKSIRGVLKKDVWKW